MINLYEYQAKRLFAKYNLPILKHWLCYDINDIKNCIKNNVGPWAVKCQIHAGGRGKSGGICITSLETDIFSFSKKWFGNNLITYQTTDIGELVNSILIEPAVKIIQEFYISIFIDRDNSQIICMASTQGGINIEKTIRNAPELIHKISIDPTIGIYPYQGRMLACKLGLSGYRINQFSDILINITRLFLEKDLMLIEINPLVIADSNSFLCLDAKITADQNAVFRQSELLNQYINNIYNQQPLNINYIPLSTGNIGCMVNGAGLAMATMDLIKESGGTPANFLDIGGTANKTCIISAFHVLLHNKQIQAILINIFGGIVCCDLVADSVITALSTVTYDVIQHISIIARLEGNNAEVGLKRLKNSKYNIIVTNSLIDAIQQVVAVVK